MKEIEGPFRTALLQDLALNPSLAETLPLEDVPAVIVEVAALQARLAVRMRQAQPAAAASETRDRLLTVNEAADRLGLSSDFLYRRSGKLPFTVRLGRAVRFSERGLEKYVRQRQGKSEP